jgi:hypothetical protein
MEIGFSYAMGETISKKHSWTSTSEQARESLKLCFAALRPKATDTSANANEACRILRVTFKAFLLTPMLHSVSFHQDRIQPVFPMFLFWRIRKPSHLTILINAQIS